MRNPYNPVLVFTVLMNMGFGSLNAGLAIMAAGEDTGDMVYSGACAALNLAMVLYVRHFLNKHQQKVVVA